MQAEAVLDFIEEMAVLKHLPRTGWRLSGVMDGESIADHCYRMSLLAMLLADALIAAGVALDAEKVLRLALLHEIGEARIGDIPGPALRHIPVEVKSSAERDAVAALTARFGPSGERYAALWDEFERGETLEARLVLAADKLEMLIQALEYERHGYRTLDRFWQNTKTRDDIAQHPILREIMALLDARRAAARG